MFTRASIVLVFALALATAMFAQTPAAQMEERTMHLTYAGTSQDFQEIAALVRTITEIRNLSADYGQMSVKVQGAAEQVGLAEWLVQKLDRPLGEQTNDSSEYKGLTSLDANKQPVDEVARVFYLNNAATVQDFQEIVNAIRTVTETRRVFTYNSAKAMAARGTPEQMGMIEWLVSDLNQPASQPKRFGSHEYRASAGDVTRVFYLANAKSPQDLQALASAVRSAADIRRMFTCNAARAIIMRAAAPDRVPADQQVAMAEWLVNQLDQPPSPAQTSEEYRVPGETDDLVRVFHVTKAATIQAFKQPAGGNARVFTLDTPRIVMLRGSESQLAVATQLMQQAEQ